MKKRTIAALLACGILILGLAGCGKKDETVDGPDGPDQVETDYTEAPDNYVDLGEGLENLPDEQKYFLDEEADVVIGVRDENVYYRGEGFNTRFAIAMLSPNPEGDNSQGLALARFWDRIDHVRFGGHEYAISDLARPRTEGFQVLEKLAADFGVVKYAVDEDGILGEAEMLGSLSGEALREAYSEREDFEDYTVCVYYLDARMSGMDEAEQAKCRAILKEKYGTETDQYLDGTLAVMLYYTTDGHDSNYNLVAIAPSYWKNSEDFAANTDSRIRSDITNCHMMVDGINPVGFVSNVFIRCDTDTVATGTVAIEKEDPGYGSRLEDGSPAGADTVPHGNADDGGADGN